MLDRLRGWIARYGGTVLLLSTFFLLWEIGVRLTHTPYYILPTPSRIFHVFFTRLPLLLAHTGVTAIEIAVGMILAACGGFALALLLFYERRHLNAPSREGGDEKCLLPCRQHSLLL